MKNKNKLQNFFKSFATYFLIWFFAMILFSIIRLTGTMEVVDGELVRRPMLSNIYMVTVPMAVLLAIVSLITDRVLDVKRTMHMSYGKVSLLSFAMNILMLVVTVFFAFRLLVRLGIYDLAPNEDVFRTLFSRNMLVAALYISVINFLISISRQVNANMGKGNLWKLITGKYHNPKEEDYIFMFLDLKSSTTAAEKMGHMKYSQMIQECYNDLTIPLQDSEARIYQYVGDEAVIMWKPETGLENNNCLRMYFDFYDLLQKKKSEYLTKYGWFPEFKAGLHVGPVIATQVGAIKREIAFHGDTLNTAARVLSLCNDRGAKILMTESLKDSLEKALGDNLDYTITDVGNEVLKGRSAESKVYSVSVPN